MRSLRIKYTKGKKDLIYQLQYGNQGPVVVEQTKEERDAKAPKVYLGNVKVVWTNGDNVAAAPREQQPQQVQQAPVVDDLPF